MVEIKSLPKKLHMKTMSCKIEYLKVEYRPTCVAHLCVCACVPCTQCERSSLVAYLPPSVRQKCLRLQNHILGKSGKSVLSNTIISKENSYISPVHDYRIFSSNLFLEQPVYDFV
jgi:hypothetical protein